jgi:anti-sigma regulatory factor (Ser/Thr protein kinase)
MGDLVPGGVRQATHSAAFYGGTAGFITCVRTFVDEGLEAAEPVLVAAPGPSIGLLREHLNGQGQRVSWADMSRIGANPARIIPAIGAFAGSYPGRPVRCVVQPLWDGRSAEQRRETIRHEALINRAFTGIPVSVLCPYDQSWPDAGIAANAGLTHPMLIRDGSAQPSAAYDAAAVFPAGCDEPLDPVPGDAAVLAYRDDLHMVRAFITGHASGAGADQRRAGDLVIAVSELAGNTYRHTGAGGRLSIWATTDELICQVQDTGHISDPLIGRHHPGPGSGNQGMWIVNQLCDLVEIRTGPAGTQIRVHMQLRPAAPESGVT